MRVRAFFRNLLRRTRVEQDLDDEVRGYCALLEAEKVARGVHPERARREARLEIGGIEGVKEQVRAVRSGATVEQVVQDLRYGLRVLRRNPAFTIVAVLTLALGIGANAAIFSVVNAVILRPLPFGEPDRLFAIDGLSYTGEHLELERRATTFTVASHSTRQATLSGTGDPVRVTTTSASPNLMTLLQVTPVLGRTLRPGDERADDGAVAVISASLWRSRFSADPHVVGRTITIDGRSRTVVGVMADGFGFPATGVQIWIPAAFDPSDRIGLWSTSRRMIGRLRPGASIEAAAAELRTLGPSMRPLFPWSMPADYGTATDAVPLQQSLVKDVRPMLVLLFAAVTVLLLITAVNVSQLLLGRTLSRGRELAIRVSLGAAHGRILRQVWTEGLLLVICGAAVAVPLAYFGVTAIAAWLPAEMPRPVELAADARVVGFALAMLAGSVLLIGGVPALRASRVDLAPQMAESGRTTQGRRSRWISNALIGAQTTLAITLVISAVLLGRSLAQQYAVSTGFTRDGLATARVSPPAFRYRAAAARRELYATLVERLHGVPGVTAAALTDRLPFSGEVFGSVFVIEGRPDPARTGEWPMAGISAIVTPEYFSVLGVSLLEGRLFEASDTEPGLRVAVVSESLAKKYWPNESAVGRRFTFPGDAAGMRTIVGVVGDTMWERAGDAGRAALFVPMAQASPGAMRVVIRTSADTSAVMAHVRTLVHAVDGDTPVDQMFTMDDLINRSVEGNRFATLLMAAFAAASLLLGAIGIYGTVADHIAQRRREIGVRLALGAQRVDIYRSVLGGTLLVVAVGAAIGIVGALAASRLLTSMLVGVTPTDPVTFVLSFAGLLLTAVAAGVIPARAAARLDPLTVLKPE